MNLPVRGQIYVASVVATGLIVIGHCISSLYANPVSYEWVFLAGLTLLTGSFTVKVPGIPARISVSETFVFTSVLLFGTCAGTVTVALDTLVATLVARRRPQAALRILFNLASAAFSIWVAGTAFTLVSGLGPLSEYPATLPEILGPLVVMTALYFLMNSGLVALALAFEKGQPPFTIWRRNFLWLSVNYFGGASVAAADVDGDGRADVVTGSGAGAPSGHVKAFSGRTGAELLSFFAYAGFNGGVRVSSGRGVDVAAADVNGDGRRDVVAALSGPGAQIRVFAGPDFAELASPFALELDFLGGVEVG